MAIIPLIIITIAQTKNAVPLRIALQNAGRYSFRNYPPRSVSEAVVHDLQSPSERKKFLIGLPPDSLSWSGMLTVYRGIEETQCLPKTDREAETIRPIIQILEALAKVPESELSPTSSIVRVTAAGRFEILMSEGMGVRSLARIVNKNEGLLPQDRLAFAKRQCENINHVFRKTIGQLTPKDNYHVRRYRTIQKQFLRFLSAIRTTVTEPSRHN